ncbi:MAG: DinB family protein [Lacinutrix sp.]|uniref:DinB family protein n=1 Tax=Lacinutrix sp. TaxID=1937692 RepID=UPI0030AD7434
MKVTDLEKGEFLPYFQTYIDRIGELILVDGLEDGLKNVISFFKSIPEDKLEYSYEANKWTVKEIISHLIDSERVFAYRAMRFARKDKTAVAGFDENDYAKESYANTRTLEDLLEEYTLVRQSTIALYNTFGADASRSVGVAGSGEVSVRALGFLIAGHEKHHCEIIKERYL